MDNGRFQLHRLARMMLSQLSPSEQAALLAKVGQLVELPRGEWLAHDARLISAADSLYLVNIDHSLRVFLQAPEGGQPEVLDIVRQGLLDTIEMAASRRA